MSALDDYFLIKQAIKCLLVGFERTVSKKILPEVYIKIGTFRVNISVMIALVFAFVVTFAQVKSSAGVSGVTDNGSVYFSYIKSS